MNEKNHYLVWGSGESGKAVVELLQYLKYSFELHDKDPSEIASYVTHIILSPGVPTNHPIVEKALESNIIVIGELEFAYEHLPEEDYLKVVAITGSNGKTTTVTLLKKALEACGKEVFCGGNIGHAFSRGVLEILQGKKFDWIVLEVSSFQCETIKSFHPYVAMVLNLMMTHGERYPNGIEDYAKAKERLLMNMQEGDYFFALEKQNPIVASWIKKSKSTTITVRVEDIVNLSSIEFWHNKMNALFVRAFFKQFNLSLEILEDVFKNFNGLEHRLEIVQPKQPRSFRVINDSKSSNWHSLEAAVMSLDGEQLWCIIGGAKRGVKDSILTKDFLIKDSIERVFLIGETASEHEKELMANNLTNFVSSKDLTSALKKIDELALDEVFQGTLLLSPAFASFDQYENYEERGHAFKNYFLES